MLNIRIAWNPSLPVIASQAFTVEGRAFADGEPFPWRELGVAEYVVASMWASRMVHHPTPDHLGAPAVQPTAAPDRARRRAHR